MPVNERAWRLMNSLCNRNHRVCYGQYSDVRTCMTSPFFFGYPEMCFENGEKPEQPTLPKVSLATVSINEIHR